MPMSASPPSRSLTHHPPSMQIYVMCEVPSNALLASEFSDIFDGFSIGSNDLTQVVPCFNDVAFFHHHAYRMILLSPLLLPSNSTPNTPILTSVDAWP